MYRLIQKYQKKLLAIFAVLLMIAFVATLGYRGPSGGGRNGDVVVAHLGQTPIYDTEMRAARDQWQTLKATPIFNGRQLLELPSAMLGPAIVKDIDAHPELFIMLHHEAVDHGVNVSDDEAREFLATEDPYIDVSAHTRQVEETVQAVRNLLAISQGIRQFGNAIKISQPVWRHEVAQKYQQVHLNLVEFPAEDSQKEVPAPTPEQLRQQFQALRNTPAGSPSADNPLGFGYQIPSRVKLQYIVVPHAQVLDAVKGTGDQLYEWEVKAAGYYADHQEEFKNIPPATAAATKPAVPERAGPPTQPAATAPAATQPTTRPFAEVKDQIIQRLAATDVQKLTATIETEVIAQLTTDWRTIGQHDPAATQPGTLQARAAGTTQAAPDMPNSDTQPASSAATQPALADPLMSFAELQKVRGAIEQKYHVSIELHEIVNEWQTAPQLSALPGIGTSMAPDGEGFTQYAMSFPRGGGIDLAVKLQVWEPSPPLSDMAQNAYVFRLTAAEAAHPPADLADVRPAVEHDWRLGQAYERATQAAAKLEGVAKTEGLRQAALPGGLKLQTATAGPFGPFPSFAMSFNDRIDGFDVKNKDDRTTLAQAAQGLLAAASPADHHPTAAVNLPGERKAIVMELAGANLLFGTEDTAQEQVVAEDRARRVQPLTAEWFSFDAVAARLGYKAEEKS